MFGNIQLKKIKFELLFKKLRISKYYNDKICQKYYMIKNILKIMSVHI